MATSHAWRCLRVVGAISFVLLYLLSPATGTPARSDPADGDAALVALAHQALRGEGTIQALEDGGSDLALLRVSHGLGADHVNFQQSFRGLPVFGAYVSVHFTKGRAVQGITDLAMPKVRIESISPRLSTEAAIEKARIEIGVKGELRGATSADLIVYTDGGKDHLAWQTVVPAMEPMGDWIVITDAATGELLVKRNMMVIDGLRGQEEPSGTDAGSQREATEEPAGSWQPAASVGQSDPAATATASPRVLAVDGTGMVFNPNPVVSSGDTTLRDNGNADSTTLTNQRASVTLRGLDESGYLKGPYVDLTAPGITGAYKPAGQAREASNTFNYTRSDERFEEVMAYYHIDAVQRYIQSLGFNNVNNRAIPVHAHYYSRDNSHYSSLDRGLHFGDGGVDDGEDADVIIHEYGHSIQHDQVPNFGMTNEGGAMGEGFGDYLAASFYAGINGGFNRECVADWDAAAYSRTNPPCLRRVDGTKHYPEDIRGEVHDDGEIWSAALWGVRLRLGAATADKVIIESHFYLNPQSGFQDGAEAILRADQTLNGGSNATAIREVFQARGILGAGGGTTQCTDSYEPNDSYQAARDITTDGTAQTNHVSCTAGDRDWMRFTATQGTEYTIQTSNLGSQSDTYLYLYDTNGATELARDDDGGGGRASRIIWSAPSAGTYFLMVRQYNPSASGTRTNYDISVRAGVSQNPDAYEPDGSYQTARNITTDGVAQANHNFHARGDQDWMKFTATQGTEYTIETLNLGSRADTYLYLYGTNGTTELRRDDDSGGGLASRIVWTAPSGGTYYIMVRQFAGVVYGDNSNYDAKVTERALAPDRYEPDGTYQAAGTVTTDGVAQIHNFHQEGDQDWVKFVAAEDTEYTIQTSNLGSRADTYIYLYGTNGTTELARDDDGGGGLASRITWTAPAAGTYYVKARHYNPAIAGDQTNYDVAVRSRALDIESYEPDNTYQQAATIATDGTAQTPLRFHQAGDQDWRQFNATQGWQYIVQTSNLGSRADTYLYLYDTNGTTVLARDDDGGGGLSSRITWTAPAAGTYYAMVRQYNPTAYGDNTNYDLSVRGRATACSSDRDEPNNTYQTAHSISTDGTPQTGHAFCSAGDRDWMSFAATTGTLYTIETSNLGSRADTYLYLYNTDGVTELAHDDDGGPTVFSSRIVWTAPASGTYYIMVRHYTSGVYGENTGYDVAVGSRAPETGNMEPDDTYQAAWTISTDGAAQTSLNFHQPGDQDWRKFTATQGSVYIIQTSNLGSRSDTYLLLYDTNGTTVLARDDDGGGGLSSRISWTAPAAGMYYVMVRHYNPATYGDNTGYDLIVRGRTSDCTDSYEADNSAATARTISTDGSPQINHAFCAAGDQDWAKFVATQGGAYTIRTSNLGSQSDTVVYLYSTDGTTLLASDDDGGGGLASRIIWTAPADGTYYIKVRHFSSAASGQNTNYDLSVTCSCVQGDRDSYESDDSYSSARTISTDGASQTHNFHQPGDQDWMRFTAIASSQYTIRTLNLGPNSDTYLYLYDTNGSTVLASDDDGGGGRASRIIWTAPSNGTYYLKVRHYNASSYGDGTGYDVAVSATTAAPAAGDSYEPDNSYTSARSITTDGTAHAGHNFGQAGDQDWMSFTATSGTQYTIRTLNLGSNSDTYLYLYGTDGATQLASDDDGGGGVSSRIVWTAPSNGTYYLKVRHYNASAYGYGTNYDVSVSASSSVPAGGDSYEPDDAYTSARAIATDGTAQANHNFGQAGDQDWMRFTATTGYQYTVRTLNLGSQSDTVLYLYGTDGSTQLATDDDGGGGLSSRIVWTAPSNGTYYIKVRHYNSSAHGDASSYDISVTGVAPAAGGGDAYEPDDSYQAATTIATNGTAQANHNFGAPGDQDWMKFTATVGTEYTIRTLNLGSNSDTILYLYGTDGTTVITSNDDGGGGLSSRIVWTAPANGTYYVKVRHYNSSAYGTAASYDVSVTASSAVVVPSGGDSFEPDDTYQQAQNISTNGTAQANHNFGRAGDQDWMRFTATSATQYTIRTSNLGSNSDTVLYLYGTNGTTLITSNDDGGGGLSSRIIWTAPASGTYYIKVRHYSSGAYGAGTNYDIGVSASGGLLRNDAGAADELPAPIVQLESAAKMVTVGTVFSVTVALDSEGKVGDRVAGQILYKPEFLSVVDPTGQKVAEISTQGAKGAEWRKGAVEDQEGKINFSIDIGPTAKSEKHNEVGVIWFRAEAPTTETGTAIAFGKAQRNIAGKDGSLKSRGADIIIVPPQRFEKNKVFLPSVSKNQVGGW